MHALTHLQPISPPGTIMEQKYECGSLCTLREELHVLKDRGLETGNSDGDMHRMLGSTEDGGKASLPTGGKA